MVVGLGGGLVHSRPSVRDMPGGQGGVRLDTELMVRWHGAINTRQTESGGPGMPSGASLQVKGQPRR